MNEKSYFCTREELKKYLIDFLVDKKGNKVSKRTLCKDKQFLKLIGSKYELSPSTISAWCSRLENIYPFGKVSEEFLFDYHKKVTKRIKESKKFSDWTNSGNLKRNTVEKKVTNILNWNNKSLYLGMLKYKNIDFDIEKHKKFSEKDLKFLVEIEYIDYEEFKRVKKKFMNMLKKGDTKILNYIV